MDGASNGRTGGIRAGWTKGKSALIPFVFRLRCGTCGTDSSAYASAEKGPLAHDAEARAWHAFIVEAEREGCPDCQQAARVWRRGGAAPWRESGKTG